MVDQTMLQGVAFGNCCSSSCGRRIMEEEDEEEEEKIEEKVVGCYHNGLSGRNGGGKYHRSTSCNAALQLRSLPMATTPPLSPEHLERGEARRRAEFGRSNTWNTLSAAGLYAVSLWKLSQGIIEEKAKILTEGPAGKLKVH